MTLSGEQDDGQKVIMPINCDEIIQDLEWCVRSESAKLHGRI